MTASKSNHQDTVTNFGFDVVASHEKVKLVANVFRSVADQYDIMNDLMSFGLHRIWKLLSIEYCKVRPDDIVLDVATGTGDLAKQLVKNLTGSGKLYLLDIEIKMLSRGRDKLYDLGYLNNIFYTQANAEQLPYLAEQFNLITIGFGLRNVTNMSKALQEFYRVLKPGGKLMILEFSTANPAVKELYDWYAFNCIPIIGKLVTGDQKSYQYLVESINLHPNSKELADLITDAGFSHCIYQQLTFGVVNIHIGYK